MGTVIDDLAAANHPKIRKANPMLGKRILSALIFIPACLLVVIAGGWIFLLAAAAILGLGAWEFWRMFKEAKYSPNLIILVAGTVCLALSKVLPGNDLTAIIFSCLVLISMAYHTIAFEKGVTTAGIDLCFTLGGLIYVGWLGSYVVALRFLPEGMYWIILAILGVGISDVGAYLFGSVFGRHKISVKVSPAKSIEGFLGGVLCAGLFGFIFGTLVHPISNHITAINGLLLTSIVSIFALLGDLGESMLKRQFNLKDSSNLIPGHGGILDRVDTWLWAGVISYYLITWFWIK
jgi:phosphatidate cytidylyltransferase